MGLDQITIRHQGWGTAVANRIEVLSPRARNMGGWPLCMTTSVRFGRAHGFCRKHGRRLEQEGKTDE